MALEAYDSLVTRKTTTQNLESRVGKRILLFVTKRLKCWWLLLKYSPVRFRSNGAEINCGIAFKANEQLPTSDIISARRKMRVAKIHARDA